MNASVTASWNASLRTDLNESTNNPVELGLYITFEVCIALFAFIDNLLVLIALWKFRSLRTPTNWFVASLAVADIAVAVFAIPCAIILRLGLSVQHLECDDVAGPSVGEAMCGVMITSVLMLTQVSIFGLLTIAVDRFIAIHYPFKYKVIVTKRRTRIAIIATWVIGIAVCVAPEFAFRFEDVDKCDQETCSFEKIVSMEYMVYVNFFACVLLPLLVMGVLYLLIFRSAKQQLRKIYFDVKSLKLKHREYRGIEFVANMTHAASTTVFELANAHKKHSKPTLGVPRADSAPPLHDSKLDMRKTEHSYRLHTPDKQNFLSSSDHCNSPSNTQKVKSGNADTKTEYDDSNVDLSEPRSEYKREDSGQSMLSPLMSLRSPRKRTLRQIRNDKVRSISCDGNESQLSEDVLPSEEENELRPRGKCHSFSGTSVKKRPSMMNPNERLNGVSRNKPMRTSQTLAPSSLNSSRFSISTTDFGVNSAADGSNHPLQRKMKRKRQFLKKEFRAARSLATVVGLFAVCWLPLHIMNSITVLCTDCAPQPAWLKDLAILLSHANSLINPLIYAYKLRDFRSAFRKILSPLVGASASKASPIPSLSNLGTVKWCCIVTSRSDVINDREEKDSYDKSGSLDSPKEIRKLQNQNGNNNTGSPIAKTPRVVVTELSNNDAVLTSSRRSEVTILNSRSNSPTASDISDVSSSSDHIIMGIPTLQTSLNEVLRSPESAV